MQQPKERKLDAMVLAHTGRIRVDNVYGPGFHENNLRILLSPTRWKLTGE